MATSKSGGSTSNGRESISKRLGIKKFEGEVVYGGEIIVRQRGTRINAGKGIRRAGDDSLFVVTPGTLKFHYGRKGRKFISVAPKA